MKVFRQYTVDGVTYGSLEEMPPEARARWDALAPLLERARTGTSAELNSAAAVHVAMPTDWASRAWNLIVVAVLGLVFFSMFSRVRITFHPGPGWWTACVAMGVALLHRVWSRRRSIAFSSEAVPSSARWKQALRFGVGIAAFGGMLCVAVLRGVPLLAHYATARAGQMTVTVEAMPAAVPRGGCRPAVKIREFTYWMRDYLCVSPEAYADLRPGAVMRLEGQLSDYGIGVERYYWTRPQ